MDETGLRALPPAAVADGANRQERGRHEQDGATSAIELIGPRIREARVRRGLGVRGLAREVSCSPSLISQIESGINLPSVSMLYAICRVLGISADSLTATSEAIETSASPSSPSSPQLRPEDRRIIELEGGVRWELLTPRPESGAEFREVVYRPGGSSGSGEKAIRHTGREYCLVLEGELSVQIGFDEYLLSAGHSIVFDSAMPHRVWNAGDVVVRSVWFLLNRSDHY